ncbi:DUF4148 domain-containing protein [Paraburkholderia dilworthii]|uniref:DUF4148 domain-containing protein n=1 Tax=Paraburkholderia dilworthii TaxID=948106 RepID=UPI0003FE1A7B|nr:DUF4148 domain-containing protein [Paraburkholderia dilworthii]
MSLISTITPLQGPLRTSRLHVKRRSALARVCAGWALIVACAWLPDAPAATVTAGANNTSNTNNTRDAGDATRAAVHDDLAAYRCAGYNPVADEINYPADVEAARDRLQSSGCEPAAGKPVAPVNGPARQRDAQTR